MTDKRMTRFFMSLADAVELVEIALSHSRGGEVYVPKARACSILTVADAVAPGVPYTETGIRRGEKLHETLISVDESRDALEHTGFYTLEPDRTWEHLPDSEGTRLPEGFELRSDTVEQLSVTDLRRMIG